jgi:alkylation response protein AidB-like acyl-CoA dehydrogenase
MAGEPWARGDLRRTDRLGGDVDAAVAAGDAALAAYLVGAGLHAVRASADYAAARRQFGQPIGDFQAVAHPLAAAFALLVATRSLVRLAARAIDDGQDDAPALAASARLGAADAALGAVTIAHQTHGAIGFTVQAGLGAVSTRVRQWSLLPPGPNRSREVLLRRHAPGTEHTKEHR